MTPDEVGTARDCAAWLRTHRGNIGRLVDREGLPARMLTTGPKGRRSLRFIKSEVLAWLDSRRERQIVATIEGRRYGRRRS